jgi:hypothetical protein
MKLEYKFIILFIIVFICYEAHFYFKYKGNEEAKFVEENGYIVIPEVISHDECDKLTELIFKELKNKDKTESKINDNKNRKDLLLPLNKTTLDVIGKIYLKYKSLWHTITPNPILAECSSFISWPKATAQVWHADTENNRKKAKMYSIGIALIDFEEDVGPLEVYPKSQVINDTVLDKLNIGIGEQFRQYFLERVGYNSKKLVCKKGSIIVWGSTVYHRGGTNISNKVRPFFYFSFVEGGKPRPKGGTDSLKKGYPRDINPVELFE